MMEKIGMGRPLFLVRGIRAVLRMPRTSQSASRKLYMYRVKSQGQIADYSQHFGNRGAQSSIDVDLLAQSNIYDE